MLFLSPYGVFAIFIGLLVHPLWKRGRLNHWKPLTALGGLLACVDAILVGLAVQEVHRNYGDGTAIVGFFIFFVSAVWQTVSLVCGLFTFQQAARPFWQMWLTWVAEVFVAFALTLLAAPLIGLITVTLMAALTGRM